MTRKYTLKNKKLRKRGGNINNFNLCDIYNYIKEGKYSDDIYNKCLNNNDNDNFYHGMIQKYLNNEANKTDGKYDEIYSQYGKIYNYYLPNQSPMTDSTSMVETLPAPPPTEQENSTLPPPPPNETNDTYNVQTSQEMPQEMVPLSCNGSNNRTIYTIRWNDNKTDFFNELSAAIKTAKQTGNCSKILITGTNYKYNDEALIFVDKMKKTYNYQNQVFITTQQAQGGKRKSSKKQRKQRKTKKTKKSKEN